jgi:hypothetical protein
MNRTKKSYALQQQKKIQFCCWQHNPRLEQLPIPFTNQRLPGKSWPVENHVSQYLSYA